MNKFQEAFARLCLKPKAECDLPGRLRMKFSKYDMLPKEALPYLHYVRDVLAMLPGVNDVSVNARIGTVLVLYDANKTNSRQIMRWVDIVVDTGIEIAKDKEWEGKDEAEIEQLVRERLILRLPQLRTSVRGRRMLRRQPMFSLKRIRQPRTKELLSRLTSIR